MRMIDKNLPVILIGGPPHSGKSVLVYSITYKLRKYFVPHFVIRASPDGEGDWSNIADQELVRKIRSKGKFSPQLFEDIVKQIQNRLFPLLVDLGGSPSPADKKIFENGTHGILLISDKNYENDLKKWKLLFDSFEIKCLAILKSTLQEEGDVILQVSPELKGTIHGLNRGETTNSHLFDSLVKIVSTVIEESLIDFDLPQFHLSLSPTSNYIHLPKVLQEVHQTGYWIPEHLKSIRGQFLSYLNMNPVSVYGRAPVWVYVYIALMKPIDSQMFFFDARLGWVEPPKLDPNIIKPPRVIEATYRFDNEDFTFVEFKTKGIYFDIDATNMLSQFIIDDIPLGKGLIISGKLPFWLSIAILRQVLDKCAWIAMFYPPLEAAVVVYANGSNLEIGDTVDISS